LLVNSWKPAFLVLWNSLSFTIRRKTDLAMS
jgi:hypothetical protein